MVIPVYNEENRIEKTFMESLAYLKSAKIPAEIIIVDDGSTDGTLKTVERLEKLVKEPLTLRVLEQGANKGKGAAVKMGSLASQGEVILFMDADNATPLSEYEKFKPYLKKGVEVVAGSRAVDRSQVKIPQPFYRQALGRLANLLIQVLAVPGIWDTQCGFKAFSRKAAHQIFPRQTLNRFGFDFEVLFLARKYDFPIKEVSVQWFNSIHSRVRLKDYLRTLFELFTIRWNDARGTYETDRGLNPQKNFPKK